MTGTVNWFDEKKGFGFIKPEDGSGDIFVHWSSIQSDGYKKLSDNDNVTFDIESSPKGRTAVNVVKS